MSSEIISLLTEREIFKHQEMCRERYVVLLTTVALLLNSYTLRGSELRRDIWTQDCAIQTKNGMHKMVLSHHQNMFVETQNCMNETVL